MGDDAEYGTGRNELSGGVFVLRDSKTLVPMQPVSFVSENDFQRLLTDFPALLSGEQIDAKVPRRWLLIAREKSIPSEEGGAGRWAVDHLFIGQDGVPTLVEVKRQSDTRLRREVVGQMLDYAANGVVYWPVDELRAEFERACNDAGIGAEEQISEKLGLTDVEAFWQLVKTNLQAGRVRMLFVADQIPAELRRIVEFLNNQMDPAEVLALELRQYQSEGLKTLVPTLFGQTEEAQQKKAVGAQRLWDEDTLLAEIQARHGGEVGRVARQIAGWMRSTGGRVWFGSGTRDGSMAIGIARDGRDYYPLFIWTYGRMEIAFQNIMRAPAFQAEVKRKELLDKLNSIEGISLPPDATQRRPSIPLLVLTDETRWSSLRTVLDWLVTEIKSG